MKIETFTLEKACEATMPTFQPPFRKTVSLSSSKVQTSRTKITPIHRDFFHRHSILYKTKNISDAATFRNVCCFVKCTVKMEKVLVNVRDFSYVTPFSRTYMLQGVPLGPLERRRCYRQAVPKYPGENTN